jgi:hypothetical protein
MFTDGGDPMAELNLIVWPDDVDTLQTRMPSTTLHFISGLFMGESSDTAPVNL